mmetsp:Transcript_21415/g.38399  ORF Transcript_21415/g.38399 Transcript_21415/m.38399 type:complete len:225 (+) Transcript_21415:1399-2073(+)
MLCQWVVEACGHGYSPPMSAGWEPGGLLLQRWSRAVGSPPPQGSGQAAWGLWGGAGDPPRRGVDHCHRISLCRTHVPSSGQPLRVDAALCQPPLGHGRCSNGPQRCQLPGHVGRPGAWVCLPQGVPGDRLLHWCEHPPEVGEHSGGCSIAACQGPRSWLSVWRDRCEDSGWGAAGGACQPHPHCNLAPAVRLGGTADAPVLEPQPGGPGGRHPGPHPAHCSAVA